MIGQETKENLKNTFKESVLILVYEFIGSFLMAIIFMNWINNCAVESIDVNDPVRELEKLWGANANGIDKTPLLMGMFVTIMFSARISGSHFNPLITFSYIFGNVRQGKFDKILGIFYILAQFAGSACAGVFSQIFNSGQKSGQLSVDPGEMFQTTILELIGSFFLVFMYLCSTEEKTKFTKDSVVQTMVLASSYLAAMTLAGMHIKIIHISPVNPAIALVQILVASSKEQWASSWIFTLIGFAGSLLALIFFRFVYKKTTDVMQGEESDDDDKVEPLMAEDN